jgi:hypothetical protein
MKDELRDSLDDMHVAPEVEARFKAWACLDMLYRNRNARPREAYYKLFALDAGQVVKHARSWVDLKPDQHEERMKTYFGIVNDALLLTYPDGVLFPEAIARAREMFKGLK